MTLLKDLFGEDKSFARAALLGAFWEIYAATVFFLNNLNVIPGFVIVVICFAVNIIGAEWLMTIFTSPLL